MTSSSAGTPAQDGPMPQGDRPTQPGDYGGQPSYAPPAVFADSPPGRGPWRPRRPGTVTTAGVLAVIWGALTILSSLISVAAGSLFGSALSACAENDQSGLCASAGSSQTLLLAVGVALIVVAALVIWGGVAALSGTSGKILVVAGAIQVVIQIIWMIETGSVAFGIVGVIVPATIIALILSAASKNWFHTVRGATF